MKNQVFLPLLLMLSLLATALCITAISGCSNVKPDEAKAAPVVETTTAPKEPQANSGQMLRLSLQKDEENDQLFSAEELGGNFNRGLLYRRVKDVTIEIDGEEIPLETALAQGKITEEALWYYGQQDARNGFCQENWESRLGLSWVTLDYGDYTVVMAKDVYETPDGQQHLISAMKVHDPQNGKYIESIYGGFYDEETWQRIDREDWGLTLEILEITPEGATVRSTQSGGQQIGTLNVAWLNVYSNTDNAWSTSVADNFEQIPLKMDGVTEFTIHWSDMLNPGEYRLAFEITDVFEPEDVHPLMRDYYDTQVYEVEVRIP